MVDIGVKRELDVENVAVVGTEVKRLKGEDYAPEVDDDDDDDGSAAGRWTKEEDEALHEAVNAIGAKNWKRVASQFLHDKRTDVQCLHRWQKVLRPGLVKGPWTAEEDNTIIACINEGIVRWSEIAKKVTGRIGKQCRERWFNHLDPSIKKEEWTEEEDRKLIEGQALLGNKWSQIAKLYLPGRPENAVKNRWNAATRRRKASPSNQAPLGSVLHNITNIANTSATTTTMNSSAAPSPRASSRTNNKKNMNISRDENENLNSFKGNGLENMVSLASLCAVASEARGAVKAGSSSTFSFGKGTKGFCAARPNLAVTIPSVQTNTTEVFPLISTPLCNSESRLFSNNISISPCFAKSEHSSTAHKMSALKFLSTVSLDSSLVSNKNFRSEFSETAGA